MKKLVYVTFFLLLCATADPHALVAETYEYDDAGRLVKVVYDDGSSVSYRYDAAGNILSIIIDAPSGVDVEEVTAKREQTLRIAPNPGYGRVGIEVGIPERSRVELSILDERGDDIIRLLEENRNAGNLVVAWNGTDERGRKAASGFYLARLRITDDAGIVRESVAHIILLR